MKYIILALTLFLVGCQTTQNPTLIVEKNIVFIPDKKFDRCPVVSDFPEIDTLTQGEIAELLVILDTNNRTCAASIKAIRAELMRAKEALEKG